MSRGIHTYLILGALALQLASESPCRCDEHARTVRMGRWGFTPGKAGTVRCEIEQAGTGVRAVGTLNLSGFAGSAARETRLLAARLRGEGVLLRWEYEVPHAVVDCRIYPMDSTATAVRLQLTVVNAGVAEWKADSLVVAAMEFSCRDYESRSVADVWTFQGSSTPERADWVLPLREGFYQRNYMGMNAADYGGGIPLVDCWTRHRGLALASLSPVPLNCSFPVRAGNGHVSLAFVLHDSLALAPGDSLALPQALVLVHRGDFFNALSAFASIMDLPGGHRQTYPSSAYEPEWCAWGYERTFRPEQILRTLPAAQRLGAGWATVDDGWQKADGDWDLDVGKFPDGEAGMRRLVDSIHAYGLHARLWWVPLEAHDSAYSAAHEPDRMREFGMGIQSRLARENPSWFQLNKDGSRTKVSWWNSYTLCPGLPEVRAYYCRLVTRMIRDWGFDGLKIDGQNLNAVPLCYNPLHHHSSPWDAPAALPEFFRQLNATVHALKPDAVISLCPCGTTFSLYHLPYVQQPVGSDPKNAWQVRLRAKAYKALLGGNVPYSGDHVELTNRSWDENTQAFRVLGEEDFASTVGVGGVVSTKFTLPGVVQPDSTLALLPAKEKRWQQWFDIYRREKLSEGEYRNLYDIAFDRPETHVIRKGQIMYYAFFSLAPYRGAIRLRGLEPGSFDVIDYVAGKSLGTVTSASPSLTVAFSGALLLKAVPQTKAQK